MRERPLLAKAIAAEQLLQVFVTHGDKMADKNHNSIERQGNKFGSGRIYHITGPFLCILTCVFVLLRISRAARGGQPRETKDSLPQNFYLGSVEQQEEDNQEKLRTAYLKTFVKD